MSTKARNESLKYAGRIKNYAKRQYALALIYSWDNRENIPHTGLSVMGAQAVRMRLNEIVENSK